VFLSVLTGAEFIDPATPSEDAATSGSAVNCFILLLTYLILAGHCLINTNYNYNHHVSLSSLLILLLLLLLLLLFLFLFLFLLNRYGKNSK